MPRSSGLSLIDHRQLAATTRRHHAGGLSRPPAELIDRLTDHFSRVTPLGIGWVHPSWRDLVIGELGEDAEARRRFLSACGVYGVMLALSGEGGVAGERALPLLLGDPDWDALGDRIAELLRELDDHDLARLLTALEETVGGELEPAQAVEAHSLGNYVLAATRRLWLKQPQPRARRERRPGLEPSQSEWRRYVRPERLPARADPPARCVRSSPARPVHPAD